MKTDPDMNAIDTYKQEIVDTLSDGQADQDDLVDILAEAHRDEALYAIGRLGRRDVLGFSYPDMTLEDPSAEPSDIYEQEVLDILVDDDVATMMTVLDEVEEHARRKTYAALRTLMERGKVAYTLEWDLMLEDPQYGGRDG